MSNISFRNSAFILRRFIVANLLNLFGMSIAFASFFVIMTQVLYDAGYNKGISNHRNVYRVYAEETGNSFQNRFHYFSRPLGEAIAAASPHVIAHSLNGETGMVVKVGEQEFPINMVIGIHDAAKLYEPDMISGSTETLRERRKILLPESMALRLFGTADALNKTVKLADYGQEVELTVAGVFKDFPGNSEVAGKAFLGTDDNKDQWENWNYQLFLRLNSHENKEEAVETIENALRKDILPNKLGMTEVDGLKVHLVPLHEAHFSQVFDNAATSRTSVYLLLCFSLLILAIAAVNFTNFTLAETPMRIRSINTQKILGADRSRLRMSLVMETVFISVAAFALSLLWVALGREWGLQSLAEASVRLPDHPLLLLATGGLSVLVGVLAGVYPAHYVTSFPPALALKGSFGLSPRGKMLRTGLICLQFVVSFVLVIGVGIMYLQSRYIHSSDYGYEKDRVIVGNTTPETTMQHQAVVTELQSVTGVEGVSFSQFLMGQDLIMGWGRGSGDRSVSIDVMPVDHHYFDVMGIEVHEGRGFLETDGDSYVFNEAARRKYPFLEVGGHIDTGDAPVIQGFCDDIQYHSLRINDKEKPMAFVKYSAEGPYAQWSWRYVINVRVAAGADIRAVCGQLQTAMERFTPGHDFDFRPLSEVMRLSYPNETRFTTQILLFSLLALVISIIGVFGLTLFESEYRRKEIGIRKIMGSSTREILYMFNRRYLLILLGCFVVAAPLGYMVGRHWLEGFAVRTAVSPLLFALDFAVISLVTMATVTWQSWKNAGENPINAIKTE